MRMINTVKVYIHVQYDPNQEEFVVGASWIALNYISNHCQSYQHSLVAL